MNFNNQYTSVSKPTPNSYTQSNRDRPRGLQPLIPRHNSSQPLYQRSSNALLSQLRSYQDEHKTHHTTHFLNTVHFNFNEGDSDDTVDNMDYFNSSDEEIAVNYSSLLAASKNNEPLTASKGLSRTSTVSAHPAQLSSTVSTSFGSKSSYNSTKPAQPIKTLIHNEIINLASSDNESDSENISNVTNNKFDHIFPNTSPPHINNHQRPTNSIPIPLNQSIHHQQYVFPRVLPYFTPNQSSAHSTSTTTISNSTNSPLQSSHPLDADFPLEFNLQHEFITTINNFVDIIFHLQLWGDSFDCLLHYTQLQSYLFHHILPILPQISIKQSQSLLNLHSPPPSPNYNNITLPSALHHIQSLSISLQQLISEFPYTLLSQFFTYQTSNFPTLFYPLSPSNLRHPNAFYNTDTPFLPNISSLYSHILPLSSQRQQNLSQQPSYFFSITSPLSTSLPFHIFHTNQQRFTKYQQQPYSSILTAAFFNTITSHLAHLLKTSSLITPTTIFTLPNTPHFLKTFYTTFSSSFSSSQATFSGLSPTTFSLISFLSSPHDILSSISHFFPSYINTTIQFLSHQITLLHFIYSILNFSSFTLPITYKYLFLLQFIQHGSTHLLSTGNNSTGENDVGNSENIAKRSSENENDIKIKKSSPAKATAAFYAPVPIQLIDSTFINSVNILSQQIDEYYSTTIETMAKTPSASASMTASTSTTTPTMTSSTMPIALTPPLPLQLSTTASTATPQPFRNIPHFLFELQLLTYMLTTSPAYETAILHLKDSKNKKIARTLRKLLSVTHSLSAEPLLTASSLSSMEYGRNGQDMTENSENEHKDKSSSKNESYPKNGKTVDVTSKTADNADNADIASQSPKLDQNIVDWASFFSLFALPLLQQGVVTNFPALYNLDQMTRTIFNIGIASEIGISDLHLPGNHPFSTDNSLANHDNETLCNNITNEKLNNNNGNTNTDDISNSQTHFASMHCDEPKNVITAHQQLPNGRNGGNDGNGGNGHEFSIDSTSTPTDFNSLTTYLEPLSIFPNIHNVTHSSSFHSLATTSSNTLPHFETPLAKSILMTISQQQQLDIATHAPIHAMKDLIYNQVLLNETTSSQTEKIHKEPQSFISSSSQPLFNQSTPFLDITHTITDINCLNLTTPLQILNEEFTSPGSYRLSNMVEQHLVSQKCHQMTRDISYSPILIDITNTAQINSSPNPIFDLSPHSFTSLLFPSDIFTPITQSLETILKSHAQNTQITRSQSGANLHIPLHSSHSTTHTTNSNLVNQNHDTDNSTDPKITNTMMKHLDTVGINLRHIHEDVDRNIEQIYQEGERNDTNTSFHQFNVLTKTKIEFPLLNELIILAFEHIIDNLFNILIETYKHSLLFQSLSHIIYTSLSIPSFIPAHFSMHLYSTRMNNMVSYFVTQNDNFIQSWLKSIHNEPQWLDTFKKDLFITKWYKAFSLQYTLFSSYDSIQIFITPYSIDTRDRVPQTTQSMPHLDQDPLPNSSLNTIKIPQHLESTSINAHIVSSSLFGSANLLSSTQNQNQLGGGNQSISQRPKMTSARLTLDSSHLVSSNPQSLGVLIYNPNHAQNQPFSKLVSPSYMSAVSNYISLYTNIASSLFPSPYHFPLSNNNLNRNLYTQLKSNHSLIFEQLPYLRHLPTFTMSLLTSLFMSQYQDIFQVSQQLLIAPFFNLLNLHKIGAIDKNTININASEEDLPLLSKRQRKLIGLLPAQPTISIELHNHLLFQQPELSISAVSTAPTDPAIKNPITPKPASATSSSSSFHHSTTPLTIRFIFPYQLPSHSQRTNAREKILNTLQRYAEQHIYPMLLDRHLNSFGGNPLISGLYMGESSLNDGNNQSSSTINVFKHYMHKFHEIVMVKTSSIPWLFDTYFFSPSALVDNAQDDNRMTRSHHISNNNIEIEMTNSTTNPSHQDEETESFEHYADGMKKQLLNYSTLTLGAIILPIDHASWILNNTTSFSSSKENKHDPRQLEYPLPDTKDADSLLHLSSIPWYQPGLDLTTCCKSNNHSSNNITNNVPTFRQNTSRYNSYLPYKHYLSYLSALIETTALLKSMGTIFSDAILTPLNDHNTTSFFPSPIDDSNCTVMQNDDDHIDQHNKASPVSGQDQSGLTHDLNRNFGNGFNLDGIDEQDQQGAYYNIYSIPYLFPAARSAFQRFLTSIITPSATIATSTHTSTSFPSFPSNITIPLCNYTADMYRSSIVSLLSSDWALSLLTTLFNPTHILSLSSLYIDGGYTAHNVLSVFKSQHHTNIVIEQDHGQQLDSKHAPQCSQCQQCDQIYLLTVSSAPTSTKTEIYGTDDLLIEKFTCKRCNVNWIVKT